MGSSEQAGQESKQGEVSVAAKIDGELKQADISASALARMAGVASSVELKLLESKVDLISTRIANLGVRLEKAMTSLSQIPTGSDLERIDVQIAALRSLIKETMASVLEQQGVEADPKDKADES